ncbi:MAG: hypothetical protein AAGU77_03170 [Bacillota bacterium]
MKKAAYLLLCVLLAVVMLPMPARADMGPKPSVVVDFKGMAGERYYATLLSLKKSTGPFSAPRGGGDAYARYHEGDEGYDVFLKFAGYQDADGSISCSIFRIAPIRIGSLGRIIRRRNLKYCCISPGRTASPSANAWSATRSIAISPPTLPDSLCRTEAACAS